MLRTIVLSSRKNEGILRKTQYSTNWIVMKVHQMVATANKSRGKRYLGLSAQLDYLGQRKVHFYSNFQDIKNEIKINEKHKEIQFMDLKSPYVKYPINSYSNLKW